MEIAMYEKEWAEDGNATQLVEIHYKFIGYIDPASMMNEILSPAKNPQKAKPVAIIA